MGRNYIYTYVLLSLIFIIVNLITLSNLTPWVDEVMILDTSYNAAFHGSWETTAWYRVARQSPFSTYPPLYQMIATLWMWVVGYSLVAVRSMNILMMFVLGGACLRLMNHHGIQLTLWTTVLFTILLWGTSEMAWIYRNGRPDMLCALVFIFTAQTIDYHLSAKSATSSMAVVATSALLLCSGIQAAVYQCGLWLFYFIVQKSRRKEIARLLTLLLTGFILGLLLVSLFMLANGRLVAFVCSIVQYSATLSSIALTVLPWVGGLLDIDTVLYTQKLLELTTASSLNERLASLLEYHSYLVLSVMALTAYAKSFKNNLHKLLGDKGFLLLLYTLYVPFFMNLAGRFTIYYRWMMFLPLMIAVTSIAARHKLWCALFVLAGMVMSVFGIWSMLPDGEFDYGNLRSFVQRQHFKSSDAVVCPFSVFYEIKPVCDTCYFVGIFPTEFLGHVDYIIDASDGDASDQPITDYVNSLQADTAVMLTAVDHCEHPSLTLYKVKTRYEQTAH